MYQSHQIRLVTWNAPPFPFEKFQKRFAHPFHFRAQTYFPVARELVLLGCACFFGRI